MNNAVYSSSPSTTYNRATPEDTVVAVLREYETVLREAADARARLGWAEVLLHGVNRNSQEAHTEYETAKRLLYVAEERMKNVAGRIISFGLLSSEEILAFSAHFGY